MSKLKSVHRQVDHKRHAAECKICRHSEREQIERDFINWRSPTSITEEYGLGNRASVYRHAHAAELFPKRQRNIRAAPRRSASTLNETRNGPHASGKHSPLGKPLREQSALRLEFSNGSRDHRNSRRCRPNTLIPSLGSLDGRSGVSTRSGRSV